MLGYILSMLYKENYTAFLLSLKYLLAFLTNILAFINASS